MDRVWVSKQKQCSVHSSGCSGTHAKNAFHYRLLMTAPLLLLFCFAFFSFRLFFFVNICAWKVLEYMETLKLIKWQANWLTRGGI